MPLRGQFWVEFNSQTAPRVLAAPNSTDSSGRPQYVFDFGQVAEAPNCTGFVPNLQIGVTVVDTTGFTFTKKVVTYAFKDFDFGAFFDTD